MSCRPVILVHWISLQHPRCIDLTASFKWKRLLHTLTHSWRRPERGLKKKVPCRSRLKRQRRNTSTPNCALILGGPTPNVTLIALPKNVSSCLIIGRQWIKSAVNESLDLSGLSLPAFDWQENMTGWQPAARRETEINSRSAMATETRWLGLYINGLVRGSDAARWKWERD